MNFKKLKDELFINGLKYEDVAKMLNISTTSFSNKINGKVDFTLSEVVKLSNFLNLSTEEKENIFF
jgi:DNA-binding helix-turn-helix protein